MSDDDTPTTDPVKNNPFVKWSTTSNIPYGTYTVPSSGTTTWTNPYWNWSCSCQNSKELEQLREEVARLRETIDELYDMKLLLKLLHRVLDD